MKPVFFGPAHPIKFLTGFEGDITEGTAHQIGHWKIIQRGPAKLTVQTKSHFNLHLIDLDIKLTFIYTPGSGGRPANWLVRTESLTEAAETPKVTKKKTTEAKPKAATKDKIVPLGSRWGETICKVWDKEARWAYYTDPFIAKKIIEFMKWFGGKRVDTWFISTTKLQTNIKALNAGKPKTIDGVQYIKSAFYTTVLADITPLLKLQPAIIMNRLRESNNGRGSGMADFITRVPKEPKILTIDVDVNVPKELAFNAAKKIHDYMERLRYSPWMVFSGKTGYHVFYQPPFSGMEEARAFVGEMVYILNGMPSEVEFMAGVQHPGPGIVSIDWSQGSSANKTVVTPFSLRWDSCFASVPVNFSKIPNFDPDVHADPDFVLSHKDLFQ